MMPVEPEPSKINFNPIINVVAGDNKGKIDFTAAVADTNTSPASAMPQNEPMATHEPEPIIIGGEKNWKNLMPSGGAPLDFSKLVVVKKE
jgi:hypothetical protein